MLKKCKVSQSCNQQQQEGEHSFKSPTMDSFGCEWLWNELMTWTRTQAASPARAGCKFSAKLQRTAKQASSSGFPFVCIILLLRFINGLEDSSFCSFAVHLHRLFISVFFAFFRFCFWISFSLRPWCAFVHVHRAWTVVVFGPGHNGY